MSGNPWNEFKPGDKVIVECGDWKHEATVTDVHQVSERGDVITYELTAQMFPGEYTYINLPYEPLGD